MAAKKGQQVDALLNRALALNPREVVRLRFDPLEAKRACRTGLALLERHTAELKKAWPGYDFAGVRALPELCDRVAGARRQSDHARLGGGESTDRVRAAMPWRRKLMPLAQSLVEAGKLPPRALKKIAPGRGPRDAFADVVDLVALLRPHSSVVEAVLGKGSLSQAEREARAASLALGSLAGDPQTRSTAADLRDRYATLVMQLHDLLLVGFAVVTSYREAGDSIPRLANGRGRRRKANGSTVRPPEPLPPENGSTVPRG